MLRLIAGEPVELASREIDAPVFKLERWREKAEAAQEGALKELDAGTANAELAAALQRVGELAMEVELLRAKMGRTPGPLAQSGGGDGRNGLARHWPALRRRAGPASVLNVPRSSFHAARRAAEDPAPVRPKGRRGPKLEVSDADLPAAVRAGLPRSFRSGEGLR